MSLHLGGGGSENDEAALWDEVFVPGRRVSLWPFAMAPGAPRDGSVRWFTDALHARGEFTVDAWTGTEANPRQRLQRSDVLAIPGGNTFDLLHHLQRHALLPLVHEFLDAGGALYGGSAGAVLLGADIDIAASADPNDIGLHDTRGLDLLAGTVVRPHHQPHLDDELHHWARTHHQRVLALPERSGVVVTGTSARNVGPDTVHTFTPTGRSAHPAGTEWDLGELPTT